MHLKKLDLGNKIKCTCGFCEGTGIYKGNAERDDLGVLCHDCNGKGYNNIKLEENMQLVKDKKTGTIYKVEDGIIVGKIKLFKKLQKRDDVNYVMYATGKCFSPKYLFEHGASEINVISYEDFLQGNFPLPITQYTCPRQISQYYGKGEFYNDCANGTFSECKKFKTQECWDKFYGEAKTIDQKRKVLKKVR